MSFDLTLLPIFYITLYGFMLGLIKDIIERVQLYNIFGPMNHVTFYGSAQIRNYFIGYNIRSICAI